MAAAYIVSKSMPCHSLPPLGPKTADLQRHVVLDQGYRKEGSVRKGKSGVDSL